jgi:Flp pilus assembly protein TadG
MLRKRARRGPRDSGQALVIMVLALVAMLAMSALVIDGGNAFVQQRTTQNGADAAAEAGAVVLAQNLTGGGHSDAEVLAAVTASANKNKITLSSALYTNVNGNSLGITVGSLGAGMPPAAAAGVRAIGSKTFGTYVGGIVGVSQLTASAQATAVAGPSEGCSLSQGCTLLPITFPVSPTVCDGTGNQITVGTPPYPVVDINARTAGNEAILGICKTANGSVGWLDVQPPLSSCPNGVPGLICEIKTPDYSLDFPIWLKTKTGNVNSKPVDNAVNQYDGQVVLIPFYDCIKDNVGQLHPGPGCPPPPYTGNGNNAYYRIVGVYGFYLDHAYINANNPECNSSPGSPPVGGNGGTGCLKGWFVQPLYSGQVGTGPFTPGEAVVVQLVR